VKYIFGVLFLATALMATELNWYNDYDAALKEAKREHKLIYIFISSSQCGWCHKFEKTVLQDETIKKHLAKEFVTVQFVRDFDEIPKQFKTSPVPRHYFIDENGKILYDTLGYREVNTFEAFMGYAEEQSNTNIYK